MSLTPIQEELVHRSAERVEEIESNWAAESEERIDAVDRGELRTIDGPTALRDLLSREGRREQRETKSICKP